MIIRQEQPNDFDNIYQLIRTAFETADAADGDEHDYALSLRNSDKYIPELALVAEQHGKLIGHIMLTKTYIAADYGKIESLLLSPVSVLLEHRKKGVGASLINTALDIAEKLEYKAVFLCGDFKYYGKFGFASVANYDVKPIMDTPIMYVLARELKQGWLKNIKGTIDIV